MPICSSCGQENPGEARFCLACGVRLQGAEASRELRKTVSVVFCDVMGSTAIGERLDPEPLRRLMLRFYEEMKTVCEAHGGRVRELIGDAVMAVFGVPVVHEDDALRAVRAAVAMRERLEVLNGELEREFGVRLQSRTGVNTGEVVVRDPDPSGALALGDAVNVAARLQSAAEPGEILLGEATWRLVGDAVDAVPVEPLALKGKTDRVPAYRLLEIRPGAEAVLRHFETPLVGRELELSQLRQAYERAVRERRCHLVTVFGPAGIGKTRLAQELARSVEGEARVLTGRCLSYGEGITYWPLREIVAQATGDRGLRELLEGSPDAGAIAARLESAIGTGTSGAVGEEVFWAVRKLAEALAHDLPLVVVFEDVHWGEPTLLDLIEYLADWVRDVPVLVVCLARPELLDGRPTWAGGKLNAASVLLDPLTLEESAELIAGLAATIEVAAATQARVAEAAAGNPLFLEQMLAMLVQGGGDDGEITVSPAIQGLLAARLDMLRPDERQLLEHASIEGEVFHVGGLVAVSQPEAVASLLEGLVHKELIRSERPQLPGEQAFRFRHALIRDAAYEAIPKEVRSDLHERHANWLERTLGDRVGEAEAIVGYHLEQACRYRAELGPVDGGMAALADRAGRVLASAGRRASARDDMPAAVNLFERGLALLGQASPGGRELMPDLALALFQSGRPERAETVAKAALRAAEVAGDRRVAASAAMTLSYCRFFVHPDEIDPDVELDEAERALAVFDELDDDRGRARAQFVVTMVVWARGRADGMVESNRRGVAFSRRAGSRPEEIDTFGGFGFGLCMGSTPIDRARAQLRELAGEPGQDRVLETLASVHLGVIAGMEGRFEDAFSLLAAGQAELDEMGLGVWVRTAHYWAGLVAMLDDDPAEAESHHRECHELAVRATDRWWTSVAQVELARALYAQGRYEEASELAQAFESTPAPVHPDVGIRRGSLNAKLLSRRGEQEKAETLARNAAAAAERTDFLCFRGDTLVDLAEVLVRGGRKQEAAQALEEAVALYERKGNIVSAAKARTLLEEVLQ